MKKDHLHFTLRRVDSYNFPWNYIISEREAGKSTAIWNKVYKEFKTKNRTAIIIRRRINDITDIYINDIAESINTFLPEDKQIKFIFKKGSIKEGVVDVYIEDKRIFRVIALSNPMSRIKSLVLTNPGILVFDEFICNTRCQEKYLDNEAFKLKEIYNTFNRKAREQGYFIKCYFLGNPYSLYNPYFADKNVDTLQLKPGAFIVNKEQKYIVYCYRIKEELKKEILANNPLYIMDESYKRYAFDGISINDTNFIINSKQPDGYRLKYIFRINHRYLGVYVDSRTRETVGYDCGKYWIAIIDYTGENRRIFAVDFDNLIHGSQLMTTDMRAIGWKLKYAIARRDVSYQNIESGYLTEEVYSIL